MRASTKASSENGGTREGAGVRSNAARTGSIRVFTETREPFLESAGNLATQRLSRTEWIPENLTVSQPTDPAEREANHVADRIMRVPSSVAVTPRSTFAASTITEKRPGTIHRSIGSNSENHSGSSARHAIALGSGKPLEPSTRTFFESRLATDLSRVRVHANAQASDLSASLHARAFTLGNDIAFGAGQYAPESEGGRRLLAHELTHVLQQGGGIAGTTPVEASRIHRWEWPWEDSEEEKLAKQRKAEEVVAIIAIPDYSVYSEAQRLDMLHKLLSQDRSDSDDERAIERIWNSFGAEFSRIAGENDFLWYLCSNRVYSLFDSIPEAARVRDSFEGDVREIAMRNMATNQEYAESEMDRLALPRTLSEVFKEPTAAQAGELARLQVAAEGVAKLQAAQEAARSTAVGYRPVMLGESWEEPGYERVTFNTHAAPPLTQLPGGAMKFYDDANERWMSFTALGLPPPEHEYLDEAETYTSMLEENKRLTAIAPYAPIKAAYDQASLAIAGTLAAFPQLYAISVQNNASTMGEFASAKSPIEARNLLADAFRVLLINIESTRSRLIDRDLDPLDLTPIHQRMFAGKEVGYSGIAWSQAFPRSVAEKLTIDHNMDRALRRLLLQSVSQIAFLIAPLAGPLAIPLLLVGTAAAGVNLYLDMESYNALADAFHAGAKPGTELVTQNAVDEAQMAVRADSLALTLALLTLGAAAVTEGISRFQASRETRFLALRTRLMNEAGAPSGVTTWRPNEVPYGVGNSEVQIVRPGSPLNIGKLNPGRRYLWVLDEAGEFRIADEGQGASYPQRPQLQEPHPAAGETPLKHGDLAPGPGGQTRGVARAGGELSAELDASGKPTGRWIIDNNSSYTFARTDGQTLSAANLDAVHELLGTTGTDLTRIVPRAMSW